MSDIAIRVEKLGKRYRIGARQRQLNTLRQRISHFAASPFDYLRSSLRPASEEEIIWALKDISFEVKRGEVIGIIGPNGAGKTTLLRILSRITEPSEGRAKIQGRVASLLQVGTGFHPELTGRENIYLNGVILGMRKAEIKSKFDEIVAFAETEKFIDTPVKRYSSGMYVRLAFAVAAHLEPEILLVDEVLAVGDAAFRKKCMGAMGEASRGGRTILFVSHDMAQIRRLCETAIWLSHGRIREVGDAKAVALAYEIDSIQRSKPISAEFVREGIHHEAVWLQRLVLKNGKGEPCVSFNYGDNMLVEIEIQRSSEAHKLGYSRVGLVWHLLDERDVRISSGASEWTSTTYSGSQQLVRLWLKRLPLYRGMYKLTLGITRLPTGRIDTWNEAACFDIVYCNPLGQGYELDRRSGMVHIDHSWE